MRRVFGFGIVAILFAVALSVQAQTDADYARALTVVYASGKTAEFLKSWCDLRAPTTSASTAATLEAWRTEYRFVAVERELFRILSAAQKSQLQSNLESTRQKLVEQLDTSIPNPLEECRKYAEFLQTNINPRTTYPTEMGILDARLPTAMVKPAPVTPAPTANTPAVKPPPSPAVPVTSSNKGVVYTVAQIGAIHEAARRKATGNNGAKNKAGDTAVKALGNRIYVTGTLEEKGRWLEFRNAKFESKNDVNCHDFRNENDDFPGKSSAGKPFTILGTFDEYDVFLYFKDCQIVPNLTGLKPSSVDATLGLRRMELPPETFLVNPGAGLKDSQIYGMYLHDYYASGVGGYLYVQYEPWLFLKDGTVYQEPYLAPNSFDAALSKKEEPQNWGTWTRQGKNFVIRWNDDDDGKPDTETLFEADPGSSNQKLSGYFERLTGGGNTAYGGNTSFAAYSGYTFSADGTFTFDSGAGGSSGNDYTGSGPNVVTSNQNATKKGTYRISGYNLELRFPDGKVSRRSFCMAGGKDPTGLIYIGTSHYLKKGK
jgi:hypothetical protein